MGRNPAGDTLGVFIPMLRRLREYRLKYKQLARSADDELLRAEYQARQASFKILINSFYGYLGFSGARFGDGALAAEVTRRGRELLQALIDKLAAEGCDILEADTDGIYLSSHEYFARPAELLARAQAVLPEGIDLEHDGSYAAMFCYKSKNYALLEMRSAERAVKIDQANQADQADQADRTDRTEQTDRLDMPERRSGKITIRGSALRSRGTEPYLKRLTDALIRYLLGAESGGAEISPGGLGGAPRRPPSGNSAFPAAGSVSPVALIGDYRKKLAASEMPVAELAKSETLSQNPEVYEQFIAQGGKPRRASAEAALQMSPRPRMGERVSYYITARAKGKTSDWQRARPVGMFDAAQPETAYAPEYYLEKIDDWLARYGAFLGDEARQ
jgi:DNA polymerase elongation subunit (family B)